MHLAYPATLQALYPILRNKEFKYNIRLLKIPTGRQPVGYLQAWRRIRTREDREQILQVARAGLEPGTAGLRVRCADHSATKRAERRELMKMIKTLNDRPFTEY